MRGVRGLILLLGSALALSPAAASPADAPFPPGTSVQTLEGLRCSVVMPAEFDPAKERSLLVVLHGNGGTETGMAGSLGFLAEKEFVVVAPKSTGLGWDKKDVDAVRRFTADLKKRLHVGEGRLHVVGFSNGGFNLSPLAFDEELKCASATWVASGCTGGQVPKWAKKGMGVLAMAGERDPNLEVARKTVDLLGDKVRTAMWRSQPGKAHEWPDGLMPFFGWWVEVQEGRFTPGECLPFDWIEDPKGAAALMVSKKTGGLAYIWSKDQASDPAAKAFQNELLLDPLVQRFGRQLVAWKAERADAPGPVAGEKAPPEPPCVLVYDAQGVRVKALQGKVTAAALAAALRSVAPDKSMPK